MAEQFKHHWSEMEKQSTLNYGKGIPTLKPTLSVLAAKWEIMEENIWKSLITQG